jgi:AraC-like DNA-binding protein/mannose-6-phosphate isomerase-like protein (cupin superfamily)
MRSISNAVRPDVVSDLLDAVRVRATVYCRSDLCAPWGFGVQAHGNPSFHVVTQGRCRLEVDDGSQPLELTTGDLVLLPHGPTHWLRDQPTSPIVWLDEILASTPMDGNGRLRYGGNGERAELVCGGFVLEGDAANPILRELPHVIRIGGAATKPAPWVAATLELVAAVTASSAPGAGAVLSRLADAMLTQALRIALAELASTDPPHAQALRDPQIAAAIHLVHAQPEHAWTVERLAAEVGYSRSAFASRFRELVGESPMSYVTRTRLGVAATLLQRTRVSIAQVARRSGYSSEASFSRAFKREFGIAPGAYRAKPAGPPRLTTAVVARRSA